MAECVVRVDSDGAYMLLDRETGVVHARGTEAEVVRVAAGVHALTEAPRLGPVQLVGTIRG